MAYTAKLSLLSLRSGGAGKGVGDEIKDKLLAAGIECYDTWPVPFPEFCKIQQKAKWTISFGEGWDGYSSGQFLNGGIGFGVLQPNFTQDYFDFNDLPPFLFKNYEDMRSEERRVGKECGS